VADSRRFRRDPGLVSRNIAEELVLVPIRQNIGDLNLIYTLNPVGVRIWELLDGQRTVRDIQARIVEEYEVDSGEAERDILDFLQQLEEIGAVVKVEEAGR